jgi:hypothetical protein
MQEQRSEETESPSKEPSQTVIRLDCDRYAEYHYLCRCDDLFHEIEDLKAEGKAFELSEQEEMLLAILRRVIRRMRKVRDVFRWNARCPDGTSSGGRLSSSRAESQNLGATIQISRESLYEMRAGRPPRHASASLPIEETSSQQSASVLDFR